MAHALPPPWGAQGWTPNWLKALCSTSPSCPTIPPAPKQVTDSQTPGTASHQGWKAKHGKQLVALEGQQAHFTIPKAAATAVGDPAHGQRSGSHHPAACMQCWPEGSGCTRHICIQAEPGFTSPSRLTLLVLAGSPSSRPGKDE